MNDKCGIYVIKNTATDDTYIGSSMRIYARGKKIPQYVIDALQEGRRKSREKAKTA